MVDVRVAHTAQLGERELADVRALMDAAFDGEFADDDFEHALGGMHTLVREGPDLVAHGSVVMRRLVHEPGGYQLGALSSSSMAADFYRIRGGVGAAEARRRPGLRLASRRRVVSA